MKHENPKRPGEEPDQEPDFYDITIRVAGWLAAATAAGMLIVFFSWLRGE